MKAHGHQDRTYENNVCPRSACTKPGLRFRTWQVSSNGGLLPDLPRIFDLLGDSGRVYRFRIQHQPELEDDTAVSALHRGKVRQVLAAAENTVGVLPDHHSPAA
jgi:hypothetical protein